MVKGAGAVIKNVSRERKMQIIQRRVFLSPLLLTAVTNLLRKVLQSFGYQVVQQHTNKTEQAKVLKRRRCCVCHSANGCATSWTPCAEH